MRTLSNADHTWLAFWPTLLDGTTVMIAWQHVAAILPPEHSDAGATIVFPGGRTLDVVETRAVIERALFP